VLGWRECSRPTSRLWVRWPATRCRRFRSCSSQGRRAWIWSAVAYVVRKRAEHEPSVRRGPARTVPVAKPFTSQEPFRSDVRVQGHADHAAAQGVLPDLQDDRLTSALGIVHSLFSTNTFPSWPLAHRSGARPQRGEINTGHRQRELDAGARGADQHRRLRLGASGEPRKGHPHRAPTTRSSTESCTTVGASDTARFRRGARTLSAVSAGAQPCRTRLLDDDLDFPRRGSTTSRWTPRATGVLPVPRGAEGAVDGPASMTFTDGTVIGAVLDRKRPSPVTDLGHQRRSGRDGLRGRRAQPRPLHRGQEDAAAARPHVPVDTAQGRSSPMRRSRPNWPPSSPYQEWLDCRSLPPSTSCPRVTMSACRITGSCCASRLSATPTRNSPNPPPAESA